MRFSRMINAVDAIGGGLPGRVIRVACSMFPAREGVVSVGVPLVSPHNHERSRGDS